MTKRYLILKDGHNSFEQFYIDAFNRVQIDCFYYYNSNTKIRKAMTHFGLPFDFVWYGDWKKQLMRYDDIIVFDSLHTAKLLRFIKRHSNARLIYWHWNLIKTEKERKLIKDTRSFCEHWTFDSVDAEKYEMKLNSQFFFYQNVIDIVKEKKVFFVGTDKGRYDSLKQIAQIVKKMNHIPEFHVIDSAKTGEFYQREFVEYDEVLDSIRKSKAVLELVQNEQIGLTSRTLEAMFLETKLITNNQDIIKYKFYDRRNIHVLGLDDEKTLEQFLKTPFRKIDRENLYPYSVWGWIENFMEG